MDLMAAAEAEVVARHRFFVAWFTGRAAEVEMDRTRRVFADDFRMIGPDGAVQEGAAVIAMLEAMRGKSPPDFAIRVDLRDARMIGTHSALVMYDEHQSKGGTSNARRSSAIFSLERTVPENLVWRHLHETWLPEH